jgi:serine/threonine protein kinase
MDEAILNTLIKHYLILERVKAGGVAIVYKARDVRDNTIVAFKILQENWSHHAEVVSRFQRETRIMAHLKHPHIITLFDEGIYENRPYIVMEFMEGGSLSERLKRSRVTSLGGTTKLLLQIASALDYAHIHDVIHRDLKPGNILMKDSNHAILTDFGIARAINSENTFLTTTGQMPGTPHYMSPEQAKGDDKITKLSDQYSLGVIAYLMTAGRLPFSGSDANVMIFQHLHKIPDPPSQINYDLPKAVDGVVLRALSKNPYDRYDSTEAFAQAFAEAVAGYESVQVVVGASRPQDDDDSSKVFNTNAPLPPDNRLFEYAGAVPSSSDNEDKSHQQGGLSFRLIALVAIGICVLAGIAFVALNLLNSSEDAPIVAMIPTEEPTATEFVPTQMPSATPAPTETTIPTLIPSGTPMPTATPIARATESATPTATETATSTLIPTETVTPTPTLTLTASATPTPTPLFVSWQSAISVIMTNEIGTGGRFDCEQFLNIYHYLLEETEMLPEELMTLLTDVNSPMYTIYTGTCQNSPHNKQAYIESVLFQDMRNKITNLLQ